MNLIEPSPWHAGERQMQQSAGVAERMAVVGPKVIRDHLPEQHRDFYPLLPYLMLAVVDAQGIPWATLLEGAPGFAHSPDPHTLQIDSLPSKGDPALAALHRGASVGLLGIDLTTRRRNRMNGRVGSLGHAGFSVDVVHTFGNCPKYIQQRTVVPAATVSAPGSVRRDRLSAEDGTLIDPYGGQRDLRAGVLRHVSPAFAERTGFTQDDLDLLFEALLNMFEHDRSAARGEMIVRGLYDFEHVGTQHENNAEQNRRESRLGCAHAHKLFEGIKVNLTDEAKAKGFPESFTDYKINCEWTDQNLPQGVRLHKRHID